MTSDIVALIIKNINHLSRLFSMHFATILWRLKKPTGSTCIFIGFLFGQLFSALPETFNFMPELRRSWILVSS